MLRLGIKRSAPEEEEALGEVVCTMNDVIMVEEGQCATGTVLKVSMCIKMSTAILFDIMAGTHSNISTVSYFLQ